MDRSVAKIIQHLDNNENFVLYGGAGSGKTETLKAVVKYYSSGDMEKRICCITHTNLAAEEIQARIDVNVGNISTIHSFLASFVGKYRKNIKEVISCLFLIPPFEPFPEEELGNNENRKKEHEDYKKAYEKYAERSFKLKGSKISPPLGKREFEKSRAELIKSLSEGIAELNNDIVDQIEEQDFEKIRYNNTKFDSLKDLTYGHDGLLEISSELFRNYPLLGKIFADSFDYVFIDEFQDTNPLILDMFINLSKTSNLTVGLFGDSMQAIYSNGIGHVEEYLKNGSVFKVPKEDNFRCSYEVVDIINKLRIDDLVQKVALKSDEKSSDRKGKVVFYYKSCESKPHAQSKREEKDNYLKIVEESVDKINSIEDWKILLLTNKSIANKLKFRRLFDIFSDLTLEPVDEIVEMFDRVNLSSLLKACYFYNKNEYHSLYDVLRSNGFYLKTSTDKTKLKNAIDSLLSSGRTVFDALKFAHENKILTDSGPWENYLSYQNGKLDELAKDQEYQEFKAKFNEGGNTFAKYKKIVVDITEPEYKKLYYKLSREKFILNIKSQDFLFEEAYNFFCYIHEENQYITMHKTKGASIENVLVVLEEFFWTEYNFECLYKDVKSSDKVINFSRKLAYVAASRTKTNLCLFKVLSEDDVEKVKTIFPNVINLDEL